ncbi:hypothetical protein ACYOEI_17870, partial [Singulisphaera rosea]
MAYEGVLKVHQQTVPTSCAMSARAWDLEVTRTGFAEEAGRIDCQRPQWEEAGRLHSGPGRGHASFGNESGG